MIEVFDGHYQITRKAHINHLAKIMPLFALLYGVQIILLTGMGSNFITESLIFIGLCLVGLVSFFYWYDSKQKTIITPEKIIFEFHPFYEQKAINIKDILSTEVVDTGASFSTIMLNLKNQHIVSLYLVDEPDQVNVIIQNYLSLNSKHFKKAS